jgi:hypothetical protein
MPGLAPPPGLPDQVEFATKPALARRMIIRALDAGVPARWVAGDEVYGADPGLRAELEARQPGYVLAIGCDRRVRTGVGVLRADQVADTVPPTGLAAHVHRVTAPKIRATTTGPGSRSTPTNRGSAGR